MAFRKTSNDKPQLTVARMCEVAPWTFSKALKTFYNVFNVLDFMIADRDESQLIYFYTVVTLRVTPAVYNVVMRVHETAKTLTLFVNMGSASLIAGVIYFTVKELGLDAPAIDDIDHRCHVRSSTIVKVYKRLVESRDLIHQQILVPDPLQYVK